jgi:cation/acetate symporter
MMVYVLFGGMTATTWVQIIKACMLLGGATFMALMVLWQFGFSPEAMFAEAVKIKTDSQGRQAPIMRQDRLQSIMGPGNFVKDPISAISFGMALMFGTAGLPHILMRFFTVPNAKEARKSVMWATTWIGYFYILTFIIGFGAITFVLTNPQFLDAKGAAGRRQHGGHPPGQRGGRQRVPGLHLGGGLRHHPGGGGRPDAVGRLGGVARPVRHRVKKGKADSADELRVSKITTVCLGIVAVVLGIAFEKQNIAFMVMLAFAIAASANFPVLFMSVLWKGCTTKGAVIGGFLGLISSVALTVVSPAVWEATLGNPKGSAWFPYTRRRCSR